MWELGITEALYYALFVRLAWFVFSTIYVIRAAGEFLRNRSAYYALVGREEQVRWFQVIRRCRRWRRARKRHRDRIWTDPAYLVRYRRYQRSRGMFAGFFIAFCAGLIAVVGYQIYPPTVVETSLLSALLSALVLSLLIAFSRAKEADVHMRQDAEYQRALLKQAKHPEVVGEREDQSSC